MGPHQAQPACPRPDRIDQHRKGAGLPGVKAVITRADFPDITPERAHIGAAPHNLRDLSLNCMAKGKVLYDGHPVAAVAATSQLIAEQALDLIEVEYEVFRT